MADDTDPGTPGPFTISGSEVASVESMTATEAVVVLADGRKATIPVESPAYAQAQSLYQGEISPIVPAHVMNAQLRSALRTAGLLDQVNAAVAGANDPSLSDAWDYAAYIDRTSAAVESLGAGLGLTSVQIDQLFIAAAQVTF